MDGACIGIYRAERLDESYRQILWRYQQYVMEDTAWFSIEFEWHMKPTYTKHEIRQLIEVFGRFPEQELLIFGGCDRIFVAAYELIRHFGGLLDVPLSDDMDTIFSYPGRKIPIYDKNYREPLKHKAKKWLVDDVFIRKYFAGDNQANFDRFRLDPFMPLA